MYLIKDPSSSYTRSYKTNNPIQNGLRSGQTPDKEYIWTINKWTKISSTSYTVRELQVKATRQHCTPIRTANLHTRWPRPLLGDRDNSNSPSLLMECTFSLLEYNWEIFSKAKQVSRLEMHQSCLQILHHCFEKLYPKRKKQKPRMLLCNEAPLLVSRP